MHAPLTQSDMLGLSRMSSACAAGAIVVYKVHEATAVEDLPGWRTCHGDCDVPRQNQQKQAGLGRRELEQCGRPRLLVLLAPMKPWGAT